MSEEVGEESPHWPVLCVYDMWVGYRQRVKDKSMGMGALWEIVSIARGAETANYGGVLTNNDL
jgi:hypothetical protein